MTATMLPHLTGLRGAIVVRSAVGRAPLYSALVQDFVERLSAMAGGSLLVFPFETVDAFHAIMENLLTTSAPSLPASHRAPQGLEEQP